MFGLLRKRSSVVGEYMRYDRRRVNILSSQYIGLKISKGSDKR